MNVDPDQLLLDGTRHADVPADSAPVLLDERRCELEQLAATIRPGEALGWLSRSWNGDSYDPRERQRLLLRARDVVEEMERAGLVRVDRQESTPKRARNPRPGPMETWRVWAVGGGGA